jgi:hypothetical protein
MFRVSFGVRTRLRVAFAQNSSDVSAGPVAIFL